METFSTYLAKATPLVAVAFGIHALYAALLYMWGSFLNSPAASAKAKEEVLSLIRSIGIFALAILLYSVGEMVIGEDTLALAEVSIQKMAWRFISRYLWIWSAELFVGGISGMGVRIAIPLQEAGVPGFLGVHVGFLEGLKSAMNIFWNLLEVLYYGIILAFGRYMLLEFAPVAILFFLPLGFIMRAFPLTRKTGSSLIALSITLYFVYPLSVLFSDYIISEYYKPTHNILPKHSLTTAEAPKELFEGGQKYIENPVSGGGGGIQPGKGTHPTSMWERILAFLKKIWKGLVQIFPVLKIAALLFRLGFVSIEVLSLNPVYYVLIPTAPLIYWAGVIGEEVGIIIILFIMEITISITAYRNLAMLIGGELRLLGLTKVIG